MALSAVALVGALVSACAGSSGGSPKVDRESSVGGAPTSGSVPGPTEAPSTTAAGDGATRAYAFPAAISANRRYLVDQHGQPFMIVGDSPQCMSTNLSTDDMDFFFANREAHGFNTAWVNLLCGSYTRGRDDASTYDGIKPFLREGDLSTPNPDYFARMDTMVQLAARHGITLFLDPAETGSFRDLLKSNGAAKSRDYGSFLGRRYRDAPNIVWLLGNDYQTDQWAAYDQYMVALSQGLRTADPAKLQTIELNGPQSTSFDNPTWPPLVDLASAYTYAPTYDLVLHAYNAKPTQPVFMVEANYEFENNTGGPSTTDETLRRQEYWTLLSGATGQLYGNGYTWGLNDKSWKKHFDTKAATQFGLLSKLFSGRPWQDLVPDQSHSFLVGGAGTYGSSGDVLDNDFATAAVTPDGSLGVVYVPTERTITVDLSKMKPGTTAQWIDPTDGTMHPASSTFKTPGKNAEGDRDWILLLQAPAQSG